MISLIGYMTKPNSSIIIPLQRLFCISLLQSSGGGGGGGSCSGGYTYLPIFPFGNVQTDSLSFFCVFERFIIQDLHITLCCIFIRFNIISCDFFL